MRKQVLFSMIGVILVFIQTQVPGQMTGPKTDEQFLSFTDASGVESQYHRFADGLDWTKTVGLLVYTDGSGEYGLKNPGSSYLLSGSKGLISVAKANNMVLLTPLAPGAGCGDGDGTCWYMSSSGYSATDKAKWSANLIAFIQGQYSIDKSRMAFGGYSSGAQWTTEFFGPGFASELMNDGVAVAISYGGSPKVQTQFTPAFKTRVPFLWDVGDADPAYEKSGQYGVIAGYNWYTSNGFVTELNVIRGLGHNRSGQFGAIMDAAIKKHVGGTTRISSKNDIWLQKNTGDCIFDRVKKSAQLSIRGAILPIIKVHIYTLAGREITASFTQIIRGNVITLSCDCRHLTENLHIVEMEIDGVSISKKMLVR